MGLIKLPRATALAIGRETIAVFFVVCIVLVGSVVILLRAVSPREGGVSNATAVNCNISFEIPMVQQPIEISSGVFRSRLFISRYQFPVPIWIVVRKDISGPSGIDVPPINGPVLFTHFMPAGQATDTTIMYNRPLAPGHYEVQLYRSVDTKIFEAARSVLCKRTTSEFAKTHYDAWKILVLTKPMPFSF